MYFKNGLHRLWALLTLSALAPAMALAPIMAFAQAQGPGLPNKTYTNSQIFKQLDKIDTTPIQKNIGNSTASMVSGYMFVASSFNGGHSNGGMTFYDISDPTNAIVIKEYDGGDFEAMGESHWYSTAHVDGRDYMAYPGKGKLLIYDVTDIKNVTLKSHVTTNTISGYDNLLWNVVWAPPYIFASARSGGIKVFDASDLNAPFLLHTIAPAAMGGVKMAPMYVVGNLLIGSALDNESGFAAMDVSDPQRPIFLGSDTTANAANGFGYSSFFSGGYMYSTDNSGTYSNLTIWEFTDSGRFLKKGSVNAGLASDDGYQMIQDNYIHAGIHGAYGKFDISDPKKPTWVDGTSKFDSRSIDFAVPLGNLVFLGVDEGFGSSLVAHSTSPDSTGPSVTYVSPKNGATNVSRNARVGFTLSDTLDLDSIRDGDIIIRKIGSKNNLAGAAAVSFNHLNVEVAKKLESNASYEIIIEANKIKDISGNSNPSRFKSVFSTGSDISTATCKITPQTPKKINEVFNISGHLAGTVSKLSSVTYQWDFGDGTTSPSASTIAAPAHSYSSLGNKQVKLTFTRSNGQSTSCVQRFPIVNAATATAPTHSSAIIIDNDTGISYNVNPDNDSVTAIQKNSNGAYSRKFVATVGDNPRTLAQAGNGDIWVVNQDSHNIKVLDKSTGTVKNTYDLPYASRPYGIAFAPNGADVYVTLEATGKLYKLNTSGVKQGEADVGRAPRGIAVNHNSTEIYVTRFISPASVGEVRVLNSSLTVLNTIHLALDPGAGGARPDTENNARGVPNYVNTIVISPDDTEAIVPSKKDNTSGGKHRDNKALIPDAIVRSILSRLDLSDGTDELYDDIIEDRIDIDNHALPMSAIYNGYGNLAFVAHQASNAIVVIDLFDKKMEGGNFLAPLQNRAPQGLVLSSDKNTLYVSNFTDRSVSIYDVSEVQKSENFNFKEIAYVPTVTSEKLNADVLAGKKIFYSSSDPRISKDRYLSCASCHIDGFSDERVWDFTQRGEGLRNTISLLGRRGMGHGNVHWTANFNEIQDFENDIRNHFGGAGLIAASSVSTPLGVDKAGLSKELDLLAHYVSSLRTGHPSPYRNSDGSLTASAISGKSLFEGKGNCISCHSGHDFTDKKLHDVGTIESSSADLDNELLYIETPTLLGVWETAPYLHDGSDATLLDVLNNPSHGSTAGLTATEKRQLVDYMKQIEVNNERYQQLGGLEGIAGLRYGEAPGFFNRTTPNPGGAVTTTAKELTAKTVPANITRVFSGAFYDADRSVSFVSNYAGALEFKINGHVVFSRSSGAYIGQHIPTRFLNASGWNTFELRVSNTGTGSGPYTTIGSTPLPFALDWDGSGYRLPADPGDGSIFRTDMPDNAITEAAASNLATSGTASQSSTYTASRSPALASRAIDGNTSGVWTDDSITHTNSEKQPYWDLDLGAVKNIDTIKLYNRTDPCCSKRLNNFHVFVSNVAFSGTTVAQSQAQDGVQDNHHPGESGNTHTTTVNRTGRYIRVQLASTGNAILSLAEVQVMGVAVGPPPPLPTPTLVNLARVSGVIAVQTSTEKVNHKCRCYTTDAGRAIDGSTRWDSGNSRTTNNSAGESWTLDLGANKPIDHIDILVSRSLNTLKNFHVFVSDAPFAPGTIEVTKIQPGVYNYYYAGDMPKGEKTSIPVNRNGRYIRIQLTTPANHPDGYLRLTEVEVMGTNKAQPLPPAPTENNLAPAGIASQSTTHYGNSKLAVASRANDGNTDGAWLNDSVSSTRASGGYQPYWDLDLGAPKVINTIELWNRKDCCANRLSNFHVFVSLDPFKGTRVADSQTQKNVFGRHNSGAAGRQTSINFNGAIARYVRVQLAATSNAILSLAEVQVLGYATGVTGSPTAPTEYNLATNGTTLASSNSKKARAENLYGAIDGHARVLNDSSVLSISAINVNGGEPYLGLDLGALKDINHITVWDSCGDIRGCSHRIDNNTKVFVSNKPFSSSDSVSTQNQSGVSTYTIGAISSANPGFDITVNRRGRYVRVQKKASAGVYEDDDAWDDLGLAEVQVFGNDLALKNLKRDLVLGAKRAQLAAGAEPGVAAADRGDLALAPYYTVRDEWATGLHMVNTSNRTQVVKLRFRRAADGLSALDFNVVLSPHDVYAGFLSATVSGDIVWSSPDTTCTAPAAQGNRLTMPAIYRAGAETGYVEVIAMGSPSDEQQPIAVAAKHAPPAFATAGSATSTSTPTSAAPASMPLDCAAVRSNFFADGRGAATGATTRTTKQGVEDNATTWQSANAASANAVLQTGGRNTYVDSGNVLKVSYFIRDNATGIEFGDNAVHIRDFLGAPAITNQQHSLLSGDLNGFDFPDLNGGVPLSSGKGAGDTGASGGAGSAAGTDPIQRGRFDALRASNALGASRIVNEWSANPAGGVETNWVLTLPGQYLMFRLPQYLAALSGPGRPAPGVDAAGELTPATACPRQAIAARGGAAAVAECDYRDLPVALDFTAYSREGRSNSIAPAAELVVSPGFASTLPKTYLPKVANVIGFSEGSGADSAFGPVDARVAADLGRPYGWLSARVSSRDDDIKVCDWDRAQDNGRVSGEGFPGAAAGRALSVTCSAVTNKAVPVIGFAAWSRRVATNPEASYARIVAHSVQAPAATAPTPKTTPSAAARH